MTSQIRRFLSNGSLRPLQVAIIGAGPAAFYTADRLLKDARVHVDLYDKLPVPGGLVRYGVAPDHPDVKNVTNKFETILGSNRVGFFGNVNVGKDVTVDELRRHYNAVVFAYGAELDKHLDIPGEREAEGKGILSARAFVSWYNGLPGFDQLQPDLTNHDRVVVIGQGNVAIDVARVLLLPLDVLAKTDIAPYALEALRHSRIRQVDIVGRRGPAQVAFTIKELREMLNLPSAKLKIHEASLVQQLLISSQPKWEKERSRKRLLELLQTATTDSLSSNATTSEKIWSLRFLRSPEQVIFDSNGNTVGLRLSINSMQHDSEQVIPTSQTEDIPTGLILRSIGYSSVSIAGVPFDSKQHVIPNKKGRVFNPTDGKIEHGVYTAGWVKRGPVGVILTSVTDAQETAESILADFETLLGNSESPLQGGSAIASMLKQQGVRVMSTLGWKRIDAAERQRGAAKGVEREKIVSINEMLSIGLDL